MKKIKNIRGFTLIELLVVISIIGLLSSIILVALSSAKQKGVQGAALEFATTNYHSLGANAVAIYNFNDPSNLLADSSVMGNNATCTGTCNPSTNTPGNGGGSLSLSNSSYIGTTSLSYPCSGNTCDHTVSVWLNPNSLLPGPSIYNFVRVNLISSYLKLNASSVIINATAFPYAIPLNQWTNITYTYTHGSPSGTITLYINGNLQPGSVSVNTLLTSSLYIYNNASADSLLVDDFALYAQSLTAMQVHDLYAIGAAKHGIAVK